MGIQNLESVLLGFGLRVIQYDPFFPFRIVVYILCYIMLEVHDLLFYFYFTEVTAKGLP